MNKLRLIATLIFFTAMGLMWFSLKPAQAPQEVVKVKNNQQPDYVALNLHRSVYDANGRKTQSLSAKKMTYFDQQQRGEFESPLLILQSAQNKGRWRISSNSGILYNNQRLLLQKNVQAINLTPQDYIDLITGEDIHVDMTKSTMVSEQAVSIFGEGIEITGSGLIADLNDEKIELTKHARTLYQSPKK